MKPVAIRQDLLAAAVDRLPDNGLRAMRANALLEFARTGLPGSAHEDWRYTSLEPAIELSNTWLDQNRHSRIGTAAPAREFPQQESEIAIAAHWLRFLNGHLVGGAPPADEATFRIDTLSSAPDSTTLYTADGLASFNAALLHDAIRITIPAGAVVTRPLALLLADDASAGSQLSTTRIVIEVGCNAKVDLIENYRTLAESPSFANVVVELRLAHGAHVNLLRLQECGNAQILTGKLLISIGQDASMRYTSIDLGGALIRNDVTAGLVRPGADMFANGLYLASGDQHIDNHVRIEHRVGPSRSRAGFRGILRGRSRCVFNSKAIVYKGADGTDAEQYNHNLLLSDKAEIDTKPELEIYADDVKCAHGATVGQLDAAALFYLRSRGLDEDAASRVLTRAFAASILGELAVASAAGYVGELIDRQLHELVSEST